MSQDASPGCEGERGLWLRMSELIQLVGERGYEHIHSTEGGVGLEPLCFCFLCAFALL